MADLQVIGAGFGRTGTTSLCSALDALGLGPCDHMREVITQPRRIRQWLRIGQGAAPDWDQLFAGYRSAVDWPVATYWRELAAADLLVQLDIDFGHVGDAGAGERAVHSSGSGL